MVPMKRHFTVLALTAIGVTAVTVLVLHWRSRSCAGAGAVEHVIIDYRVYAVHPATGLRELASVSSDLGQVLANAEDTQSVIRSSPSGEVVLVHPRLTWGAQASSRSRFRLIDLGLLLEQREVLGFKFIRFVGPSDLLLSNENWERYILRVAKDASPVAVSPEISSIAVSANGQVAGLDASGQLWLCALEGGVLSPLKRVAVLAPLSGAVSPNALADLYWDGEAGLVANTWKAAGYSDVVRVDVRSGEIETLMEDSFCRIPFPPEWIPVIDCSHAYRATLINSSTGARIQVVLPKASVITSVSLHAEFCVTSAPGAPIIGAWPISDVRAVRCPGKPVFALDAVDYGGWLALR